MGAGCSPFTTFSEVHMAKKKKAKKKAVKKKKPAKKKKAVKKKVKKKAVKKKAVKKKKKAVKKKVAKKKAKKKKAKRKPNPQFMKPVQPDAKLAEVVGSKPLPRTQLTKKLWAYIKKKGCMTSADAIGAISDCVYCCLDAAVARTKGNRRSTVKAQDV